MTSPLSRLPLVAPALPLVARAVPLVSLTPLGGSRSPLVAPAPPLGLLEAEANLAIAQLAWRRRRVAGRQLMRGPEPAGGDPGHLPSVGQLSEL